MIRSLSLKNGGSYSKLTVDKEAELMVHLEDNNYVYARDIGLYIERQYGVIYTLGWGNDGNVSIL